MPTQNENLLDVGNTYVNDGIDVYVGITYVHQEKGFYCKMRLGLTQVNKHVENRPLLRPARRGKTRSLRMVLASYKNIKLLHCTLNACIFPVADHQ